MVPGRVNIGKVRSVTIKDLLVVLQMKIVHWHCLLRLLNKPQQAKKHVVMENAVALARTTFETLAIGNYNLAAAVFDQALCLQVLRQQGERRASRTQHLGEEFLRERHGVTVYSIRGLKQPPAEAGRGIMQSVASC